MKHIRTYHKTCDAMKDAGIEDPESQDGRDFCTKGGKFTKAGGCPYTNCIVFEGPTSTSKRIIVDIRKAKEMRANRIPIEKIAKELGRSKRTINRYLES